MTTAIDVAPLVSAIAQLAIPAIGTVIYALLQSHLKDQAAKDTVLKAIKNGVSFGLNKVDGALAGKPLNVQLGSSVATQAVKYAMALVPDAAKRLGLNEASLAKIAVAKLPGVEGHISDEAINGIAAAATGRAVASASTTDIVNALIPAILPEIEKVIAARATTPAPHDQQATAT